MLFYRFLLKEITFSFVLSIMIISSVLYIFSIIELLNGTYTFSKILILGLINTFELLITIPTIIYLMSIILFWNNTKKTNELIIIRHYLSLKRIIIIFSIFIIIFTLLEINKSNLNNKITELKEEFFKKSNQDNYQQKTFYKFNDNRLTITRIDGLNISNSNIDEVSVYEFKNNNFFRSIYSGVNTIKDNKIVMKNPKLITSTSINDLGHDYEINLKEFGENFYNNSTNNKILKNNKSNSSAGLLKKITFLIILYTYLSIFITKKGIQKNSNVIKYSSIAFLVFSYSFITSEIYLLNYNSIFHMSVLLTFTFYLYKNLINE